MGGILISLVLMVVGYYIVYLIIRAAINHSDLAPIREEFRAASYGYSREKEEMTKQLNEIKLLLQEQNELLRDQNKRV
jgi:hypothetical protein